MSHIDDGIVVVELVGATIEAHVVYKAQAVNRLYKAVVLIAVKLLHHGFCRIEQHALLEILVPIELHFNNKLTSPLIMAAHVDHTVLFARVLGHQLRI